MAGSFWYTHATYQDSHTQIQQSRVEEQIENHLNARLPAIQTELRKEAETNLRQGISGVTATFTEGLRGVREDAAKTNQLLTTVQQEAAKTNGKLEEIDRDVNLLLQRQIRGAANLPASVLASQIPNLNFLYQMASERKVPISSETTNEIRLKLATVDASAPDFWPFVSAILSKASRMTVGDLAAQRTLTTAITGSYLEGVRVSLDGLLFVNNTCDRCVVEYHGGNTDVTGSVFTDCLFIIAVDHPPPLGGQKMADTLLASADLRSVAVH